MPHVWRTYHRDGYAFAGCERCRIGFPSGMWWVQECKAPSEVA